MDTYAIAEDAAALAVRMAMRMLLLWTGAAWRFVVDAEVPLLPKLVVVAATYAAAIAAFYAVVIPARATLLLPITLSTWCARSAASSRRGMAVATVLVAAVAASMASSPSSARASMDALRGLAKEAARLARHAQDGAWRQGAGLAE